MKSLLCSGLRSVWRLLSREIWQNMVVCEHLAESFSYQVPLLEEHKIQEQRLGGRKGASSWTELACSTSLPTVSENGRPQYRGIPRSSPQSPGQNLWEAFCPNNFWTNGLRERHGCSLFLWAGLVGMGRFWHMREGTSRVLGCVLHILGQRWVGSPLQPCFLCKPWCSTMIPRRRCYSWFITRDRHKGTTGAYIKPPRRGSSWTLSLAMCATPGIFVVSEILDVKRDKNMLVVL